MSVAIICMWSGLIKATGATAFLEMPYKTEAYFLKTFIDREESFSINWEETSGKVVITIRDLVSDEEQAFIVQPRSGAALQLIPAYLDALGKVRSAMWMTLSGAVFNRRQRVMVLHDLIRNLVPLIQKEHLWDEKTEELLRLWDSLLNP